MEDEARYRTTLVRIPTPEENALELKVKVININSEKSHEILRKCRVLREYSLFVDTVRKYEKEEGPLKKAIQECIGKGILTDYLKRKGSEVRNMLIAEYSYEKDMDVKQREAHWAGRQEGMLLSARIFQKVRSAPFATDEQIAGELGCAPEDVENTRKLFGL